MAASNSTISAFCDDGKFVAVEGAPVPGRIQIHIYELSDDATACKLHFTVGHSAAEGLRKLVFHGSNFLVGLVGTHKTSVVIWDIQRGVMADELEVDDHTFLDLGKHDGAANAATAPSFFALVGDNKNRRILVQEYSGTKCVRKIKTGKWKGTERFPPRLAVSKSIAAVAANDTMYMINTSTGKKLQKYSIPTSNVDIAFCRNSANALVLIPRESGTIMIYHAQSNDEPIKVGSAARNLKFSNVELLAEGDGGPFTLLVDRTILQGGTAAFTTTTTAQTNGYCLLHLRNPKQLLTISKKASKDELVPSVVAIDADTPKVLVLSETASRTLTDKRKSGVQLSVLGPGQAGTDATLMSSAPKRQKTGDAPEAAAEGMSISEKLKQLNQHLDLEDEETDKKLATAGSSTTFNPKKATASSLKQLLSQALTANDSNLLEVAFTVRDTDVVENTLKELVDSQISQLIDHLTTRIAANPMRADALSGWLSVTLTTGRFEHQQLVVLQNLLSDRVDSLSDLIRLEGRLSIYIN
mmetsp:Transcript_13035/g.37738  ORF Transcript_13035/g.37738 Transcript_13035/m.37738 type:complete len:526 (+) Transcript_13035:147-1724(+)